MAEWESSDDEAPEEEVVDTREQEAKLRAARQRADAARAKERANRRKIQEKRDQERLERAKAVVVPEEEEIPEELPESVLAAVEIEKPTRVVFNAEEQRLEKTPTLLDARRARVAKLRELRGQSVKQEGPVRVVKVQKQGLRKQDVGQENFKANWLSRESVRRE